jgi:acyl-CoA reductase-like NAD-dependent aldehyde dehydrogenase
MARRREFFSSAALVAEKESWARAQSFSNTIDGAAAKGGTSLAVVNPATGLPFAEVAGADRAELDLAFSAATAAFARWRRTNFTERAALLRKFADAITAHEETLATLVTLEQGRPYEFARMEVRRNVEAIRQLTELTVHPVCVKEDERSRAVLHYRPLGVVAAIAPWNVPVTMAVGKLLHALLTGNTLVLKPSPYTPLATLKLGEIGRGIFPPGVMNVVAGGNELGQRMSEHPAAAKVTFTGSTATGRKVAHSAAGDFKRLTLELGGNDAAIVLDDVDVDAVAPRLFGAAFLNSGQICMAIKRLYVQEGVYDSIVERLATYARQVRVGDGFAPQTQLGPVQNEMQLQIVKDFLESAAAEGADFAAGGYALERPAIALGLREGSRLVDGEPFGPVLPILPFRTVDEAVARANATSYGLGASVWSDDLDRAGDVAEVLEAGTIWLNDHAAPDPMVPFGGIKQSGVGRESGLLGLLNFMEPISIVTPRMSRASWFKP